MLYTHKLGRQKLPRDDFSFLISVAPIAARWSLCVFCRERESWGARNNKNYKSLPSFACTYFWRPILLTPTWGAEICQNISAHENSVPVGIELNEFQRRPQLRETHRCSICFATSDVSSPHTECKIGQQQRWPLKLCTISQANRKNSRKDKTEISHSRTVSILTLVNFHSSSTPFWRAHCRNGQAAAILLPSFLPRCQVSRMTPVVL